MKKTSFLAFLLLTSALAAQQPAQVTVQGDAKVGLIVTGTGNVINTTQIFGKSPEYAELKKRLDGLQAAIIKKADECEQMRRDNLPAWYCNGCRAELIALNAARDSVQKIETRFREDVIRLAETFSKIELNSERLRLAKRFFEEGKIREADNVLNIKEMKTEGEALFAKKEGTREALRLTDSLLRIKADEFALKARFKATDYGDSLRYDSAEWYFTQSLQYAESVQNLHDFAFLLYLDNQLLKSVHYFEKALSIAESEGDKANLYMRIGNAYSVLGKMPEAEQMYLLSLGLRERLAEQDSLHYQPDLAKTLANLGILYTKIRRLPDSEKMFLRAIQIQERLARQDPVSFEPNLGRFYMSVANYYLRASRTQECEKMNLHSISIFESLSKKYPAEFEPDLARSYHNLGFLYHNLHSLKAEEMYLKALNIQEKIMQNNPYQFGPDIVNTLSNLGNFYKDFNNAEQAENMYAQLLDVYEKMAKSSPLEFTPPLTKTCGELSWSYLFIKKPAQSQAAAERALSLDPARNWVRANLGHSWLLRDDWDKAKQVYEQYIAGEQDPAAAKAALLQDWDALEKAGVTHPDMEKARKWVRE